MSMAWAEAEVVVVPESAAEAVLEALEAEASPARASLQEGCRLFLSTLYPSQYALFGVSSPSAICQGLALAWAGTEVMGVVVVVVVRGAVVFCLCADTITAVGAAVGWEGAVVAVPWGAPG